jgi:hypothetical protein
MDEPVVGIDPKDADPAHHAVGYVAVQESERADRDRYPQKALDPLE